MLIPPLHPETKDWIQVVSWIVAGAAGLFGIIKIPLELKHFREQRAEELRWRKAEAAKSLNDQMIADVKALAAMTMLDWDGRKFNVADKSKITISTKVMLRSLEKRSMTFEDNTEAFVRDAFDELFYHMGLFQHYIARGLVDFKDLEQPIEYYVKLMVKHLPVFDDYLVRYGFTRASAFLLNFPEWENALPENRRSHSDTGPLRTGTNRLRIAYLRSFR